jgi:hypothetical protein
MIGVIIINEMERWNAGRIKERDQAVPVFNGPVGRKLKKGGASASPFFLFTARVPLALVMWMSGNYYSL